MAMAWTWTAMVVLSLICGLWTGQMDSVAAAAMEGASSAIELALSMAGILCLWSGVMEVMNACGISAALARLFRPVFRRLLPRSSRDEETLAAVTANVSANLLGLGNAATPLGIWAARRMAVGCGGIASNELCLLVVLNTAPSSFYPPRLPLFARRQAAPLPLISFPLFGSAQLLPWRRVLGRRGSSAAWERSIHEPFFFCDPGASGRCCNFRNGKTGGHLCRADPGR